MDKFLANAPKSTLAFIAVVGGILLIVFSQPPASICDSQIEVIKKSQDAFLYKDPKYPKAKTLKTTRYEYLRDHCKTTNSPGGCYELFQEMKVLLQDLNTLPEECAAAAGSEMQFKRALNEVMDLIVRLAWGEKPPAAYHSKFGWLDTADISLYCKLKGRYQATYGEGAWTSLREKMMKELPGAAEMPRNQVWDMIIFSENCARYP